MFDSKKKSDSRSGSKKVFHIGRTDNRVSVRIVERRPITIRSIIMMVLRVVIEEEPSQEYENLEKFHTSDEIIFSQFYKLGKAKTTNPSRTYNKVQ